MPVSSRHSSLKSNLSKFEKNNFDPLCSCAIEDKHLDIFKKGITKHRFLETLSFKGTKLTDRSFLWFADLWEMIPFLKNFSLTHNQNLKGKLFIQHFLKRILLELQIESIDLSNNVFSESASNSIIKHLLLAPIDKLIQ